MVIYYKNEGSNLREIEAVEFNVMSPTIPANMTLDEKVSYYNNQGLTFVSLPYEMGGDIFYYQVCVNDNNEFIGLQPKGGI